MVSALDFRGRGWGINRQNKMSYYATGKTKLQQILNNSSTCPFLYYLQEN